ncbi:unnamed protein product [Linum tenue]|uniref:Uncharacterized protein n=1 Tax=Linum tenue TaxID=586396 RepID=A0AAV0HJ95_9ROSI|nr:unnamed protein product [Linum tenue]
MDRSSHEYHDHISNIIKAPSVIHGAPQYPNVHKAFNHDHRVYFQSRLQQAKPRPKKRVQLTDLAGRAIVEYEVDVDESFDSEADGFVQQKQKNFELCKWKTFRMY